MDTRIGDFLLHGSVVPPDGSMSVAEQYQNDAKELIEDWEDIVSSRNRSMQLVEQHHIKTKNEYETLLSLNIDAKYREYRKKEYQTQLLNMAQSVEKLDAHCGCLAIENGNDSPNSISAVIIAIPALVLETYALVPRRKSAGISVSQNTPSVSGNKMTTLLLPNSRAYELLKSTCSRLKASLLARFHLSFEAMLDSSSDPGGGTAGTQMWQKFLSLSQQWLLGYTALSMLPVAALPDTAKSSILRETYQNSIDEAIGPLWGRFRFHLQHARDSRSVQQVLWSFQYAKSFSELLLDLCSLITISSSSANRDSSNSNGNGCCLQQMLVSVDTGSPITPASASVTKETSPHLLDYVRSAQTFLVNKCVRFFQAHLAQVLANLGQVSSSNNSNNKIAQGQGEEKEAPFPSHARGVSGDKVTLTLQLVEQALILDKFLTDLLTAKVSQMFENANVDVNNSENIDNDDTYGSSESESESKSAKQSLSYSVVEVLCAAKPALHLWVKKDCERVRKHVLEFIFHLGDQGKNSRKTGIDAMGGSMFRPSSIFEKMFGSAFALTNIFDSPESSKVTKSKFESEQIEPEMFCYQCIYDLLNMLVRACTRYGAIPASAAKRVSPMFSAHILHPLMHLIVSVMLIRIHSSNILHDLQAGLLPKDMRYRLQLHQEGGIISEESKGYVVEKDAAFNEIETEKETEDGSDYYSSDEEIQTDQTNTSVNVNDPKLNGNGNGNKGAPKYNKLDQKRNALERETVLKFAQTASYVVRTLRTCSSSVRQVPTPVIKSFNQGWGLEGDDDDHTTSAYDNVWTTLDSWIPKNLLHLESKSAKSGIGHIGILNNSSTGLSGWGEAPSHAAHKFSGGGEGGASFIKKGESSQEGALLASLLQKAMPAPSMADGAESSALTGELGLDLDTCAKQVDDLSLVLQKQLVKALRKMEAVVAREIKIMNK